MKPAGQVSERLTPVAVLGPALRTVMVKVRVRPSPAVTVVTPSLLVTERSADVATVVVVVALSLAAFGSLVAAETVAVLLMTVPAATLAPTWTMSVKVWVAPAARLAIVQVTVPLPPTAGVVQLKPAGAVSETKVVPAGRVSVRLTLWAALGPALATVMV